MVNYVCQNCNFKFKSDDFLKKRKCPYCSKEEAAPEKSAEDLINED